MTEAGKDVDTKANVSDDSKASSKSHDQTSSAAGSSKSTKPRSRAGRAFRFLGLALLLLLLILTANALTTKSRQLPATAADALALDEAKAAEHLARAITFKTVSLQDPAQIDGGAFAGLHKALEEMFPKVHQTLTREIVNERSLLYTWKGKDASKQPIILMAHMDVVPVEPGTEAEWEKPPFSGAIEGGFVWGRGSIDFKNGVIGQLEAVEALLAAGYTPSRTVYLAYGHDEEIGGQKGARAIVELLASRNVRASFVMDEGMVITQGILKGIDRPVALIGLAEKGYVSLELIAETQGGHSSMPPRPTTAGVLAAAILRLENSPMPARIEGPAKLLFETLAPEMPFGNRLILSNLWLLSPIAKRVLSGSPATDAILRTTTAPTILEGSVKENVLPKRARAVVNFRILPGDSTQSVIEHVNRVISDSRVKVQVLQGGTLKEPSSVSDLNGPGYKAIEKAIRQIVPDSIVAPSLVLGSTDSYQYQGVADGVYRFSPQRMKDEDRARFHGTNERVSVQNFGEHVRFYAQLIRNAD
ncbi:MAG: M20 family peptidase [Polyangiaceae bacterium]|nr:M20 family peptidase [Polyangiaceae bacterium]